MQYDFQDLINYFRVQAEQNIVENEAQQQIEDVEPIEEGNNHAPSSKMMEEYITGDFDTENDKRVKQVVATALMIAQKKGYIVLEGTKPEHIASAADVTTEHIKTAYKVENGEMSVEDALCRKIDAATTRVTAIADRAVEKGCDFLTDKLIPTLSAAFPKLAPLAPVASKVVKTVQPKIRKIVHKGLQYVSNAAKRMVPTLVEKVRKAKHALKNWLFS